jgi:hypothetical protein
MSKDIEWLDPSSFEILKQTLTKDFVPNLPALLQPRSDQKKNEEKNLSRAFSAFVISKLCEVDAKTAAEAVIDDFNDQGIDAIYYHGETLYLVQSKLKAKDQFSQIEALAFCEGVRQFVKCNWIYFNQHFQNRIVALEAAIEDCSSIQLVVSHVGSGVSKPANDVLIRFLETEMVDEQRLEQNYINIDHVKIENYLLQNSAYPKVDADIFIEKPQVVSTPRTFYIGFVLLSDLASLHKTHGKALYEKNIRTFLGMGQKHRVNESIRETLKQKPEEFCYLNNGVTALCDDVTQGKQDPNGKRKHKTKGFSVINGAQTISSAADASANGIDISQAKVLLTLIKADADTEFAKRVTKARNHQNPVSLSDFAALHENQEHLSRKAAYLGITYEYKAGHNDRVVDNNYIRLDEAVTALALCHPDPRYAVWLKKEPEQLYSPDSDGYRGLFTSDLSVHKLINAVYFSRYLKKRMLTEENAAVGSTRLTYKHGVYGLGWVLAKRFKNVIHSTVIVDTDLLEDKASIPFDELRNQFETQVDSYINSSDRGALSVFRNRTHALPLLQAVMLEHYGLTADPIIPYKQSSKISDKEEYPKALFDYMVENAPQITLVDSNTTKKEKTPNG